MVLFIKSFLGWTLVFSQFTNSSFPDSDYGWTFTRATPITAPYTTTCGNVSLFGGYNKFGMNLAMEKYINLILPHYLAQIQMKFYKIDAWDLNVDQFNIYDYTTLLGSFTYATSIDPNTFLCGSSNVDAIRLINLTFSHTTQLLDLKFQDSLSMPLTTKSYGFRDLKIFVSKCDLTCFTCTGSLSTQCSSCYPFAGWHFDSNTCLCNQGFFSSYNLDQSNTCSVMPCTTCLFCNETCLDCKGVGANNCTSCFAPNIFSNNSCISPISITFSKKKKH